MSNVLVINMGLKSIRCIIFNQQGTKLGSASCAINTAINDKCVEQEPNEWWEKAKIEIRKALLDARLQRVDFITVTTSASCLVCMDSSGNAIGKALMISDKRAEKEAETISQMPEFKKVYYETGLAMSVSLMLPKILWVKQNQPGIFERTSFFLTPNDYLIYQLSGKCITDYFNAIKYHYNVHTQKYPEELLNKMGIYSKTFPKVMDSGEKVGAILPEVAEELGINKDCQIIISSYDAICSFVGSGVVEEGESSDVSGTVTVFRTLSKKKNICCSNKVYNIPFYKENAQIVGGSNNLGGGLIEWVKQCYYLKEEYPYEIMEKDAGESEIGARGLVFLPYLLGERTPLWDDNARGVFFGLERMHTRKDMTRAVFESTGFIDMDIINAIQETGVEVESVRLSGGLARINLISQIKADILGKDVMVLSEFETTASGAAMMTLLGQNVLKSQREAADKFAKIRMVIKPDMDNHKKYEYMYLLYKETYKSLKELFVKRKQLIEQIRSDREVRIENL